MSARSRTFILGALAVAVCAAAGFGIWRAVDGGERAGATGIRDALERNQAQLMTMDGVVGVGIGERAGKQVIQVYLEQPSTAVSAQVPDAIDGYPVITQVTGAITAQPGAVAGGEPGSAGSSSAGSSGSAGGGEPGSDAGTVGAVPIEPGAGDGGGGGAGGGAEPGQTTGLDVRGTVTSVAVLDVTDADQQAVGAILVEGRPSAEARYDKASVTITTSTHIFAQVDGHVEEVHPEITELQGARVEVGFTGPVAESYPVQATAAWINIL